MIRLRPCGASARQARLALASLLILGLCASAEAQTRNWPSERPPRPLAERNVKFPPYAVKTLANGLQVIAVSHHEQPAVSLRLLVRAGAAQDPDDKPGVAALLASLLDQGTTTRSAEQIANSIDSIGGALGTGAGTDLSFVNAIVMKDSLNFGLDLVSDIAQNPAFAAEEIERQRQQSLSGMRVSYEDPEFLANVVFDRLVYGQHPYGRPQNGSPETLTALTREDLVAFHRKWFGANNAILAIVGDVTAEEAFAGAERAFGKWMQVNVQVAKPADPPPPTRRVVVIDKPGAVQTEIRVGNIGIPRKSDDFMALDLAAKVLGGEGANRLHRVLRSERGLTYGAEADFNALKHSGDIVAKTNTRSETTGETLRLMVDEVWKLLRDRVGDRELEGAQEYLTGSFPLTIETPSQIALQILNAVFFGLDMNELQTYRERVSAVTVEDVQRVARNYLHPDRLTIVLVGDASAFTKQLPGAGFDKFDVIPAADLDLSAPDLRRKPVFRLKPEATTYQEPEAVTDQEPEASTYQKPEAATDQEPVASGFSRKMNASYTVPVTGRSQRDEAKALLNKAIAAKGGLAKLQGIKTVKAEGTMSVATAGKPATFKFVQYVQYPDRFRTDGEMPGGQLTQVFADGKFWIRDANGAKELDAESSEPVRAIAARDMVRLLIRAEAGELVVRSVDTDTEDPLIGAIEISGPGVSPVTLIVNRDNGLIEQMRYVTALEGRCVETYSDYRNVSGIQVPFHTVQRRGPMSPVERDVRTIHFNVPLDAALFVKPS